MSALRVSITNPAGTHVTELLEPGDRLQFHHMLVRWAGAPKIVWGLDGGLLRVNGAVVGAELPDLEPATLAALAGQHRGALHSLRLLRAVPLTAEAVAGIAELAGDPLWLDLEVIHKLDPGPLRALPDPLRGLRLGKLGASQAKQLRAFAKLEMLGTRESGDAQLGPICALPDLRILELADADVTAAGLQHLADAPALRDLAILYKPRERRDPGFEHCKPLTRLTRLRFWYAPATDDDLRHLAGLTALRSLHLEGTSITDAGLVHLLGLTELDHLHLPTRGVTDAGIDTLVQLRSLMRLNVKYTQITAAGLERLRAELPGCEVHG
jgi:hypothetical protein